jgi:hypothetical protein
MQAQEFTIAEYEPLFDVTFFKETEKVEAFNPAQIRRLEAGRHPQDRLRLISGLEV